MNPDSIRKTLGRVERTSRALGGFTTLLAGVVVAGLALGAAMLLDAAWRFGGAGRWVAFLVVLAPLAAGLLAAIRQWRHRRAAAAMARRLEVSTARDDNALVNAVQLDAALPDDSPWRSAIQTELARPLESMAWSPAFPWRRLRAWSAAMAALALAGLLFHHASPGEFRQRLARVLQPAKEVAPVTKTRITDLQPGNHAVPAGTTLAIHATIEGDVPVEAWLTVRAANGRVERQAMLPGLDGTRWEASRRWEVASTYFVTIGDAVSFERHIDILLPAKPVRQNLRIQPPAYTRLPAVAVESPAPWPPVPAGSVVNLESTFDRPLQSLAATDATGATLAVTGKPGVTWSIGGTLAKAREWNLQWTGDDGISGKQAVAFTIKPDEPPKLQITDPAGDGEVLLTADGWLKLTMHASDDHGLAEVAVFHGSRGKTDALRLDGWSPAAATFSQSIDIPLAKVLKSGENEAVFMASARDNNDVTGPGVIWSRPIVVRIVSPDELQRSREAAESKQRAGLEDLVQLQRVNLDGTRQARTGNPTAAELDTLVERQSRVELMARQILGETPDAQSEWRAALEAVTSREIPAAALALRDASSAAGNARTPHLKKAEALQTAILAALQSLPGALQDEATQREIRDLIARVEALFQRQKNLHVRTLAASSGQGEALARDQDALAAESQAVRKALDAGAANASLGDARFREALAQAATSFATFRIYEGMLRSAEKLEQSDFPAAAVIEKETLVALAKILEKLNAWLAGKAGDTAEAQREAAGEMQDKLDGLIERQKEVVEKSKELASKDAFRPEDLAVAKEMAGTKEEMARLIEQMLTDAHIFPDLRPMNELREELTKIYEDVIQQDKELAAQGKLKPSEIAVQKEESMLEALEKAKETAEDMEMWLPDKNETQKWLMENFDQTEMPEIPNLPLADAFTDLVGDLLEEQEGLSEEIQDAASNQAMAMNPANGWEVRDGPMPGFNAQGRSGNERPNQNEQTGRSSGGREGMSSGEMVNQRADNLEGSEAKARRTNDPLQQGQVIDDGPPANAKATGGGKAGGASQREGMTGQAPLRPVQSPRLAANDALAAAQAQLSQQTARSYATARLFYLRTGPLPDVARLMDQSRDAIKAGRLDDFQALHQRIVAKLQEMGTGNPSATVQTINTGASRAVTEKRLPGGKDVPVPAGFQDEVNDYFRALDTP